MRLGFAIAAHLDADILLLDEVFAVGDEAFQRKCFGKVFEFKQRGGTIVFVSHDATQVERLCERAVLLRDGRLEFDGPTHEAIVRYRGCSPPRPTRPSAPPACASGAPARRRSRRRGSSGARAGAAAVPRRRAVLAPAPDRGRERDRAAAAAARAARRGRPARRVGRARHRPRRLGRRTRELRYDVARCRSRTAASTSGSGSPTRAASAALARRRAHLLVYPAGEERGVVRLEGSWAAEQNSEER